MSKLEEDIFSSYAYFIKYQKDGYRNRSFPTLKIQKIKENQLNPSHKEKQLTLSSTSVKFRT